MMGFVSFVAPGLDFYGKLVGKYTSPMDPMGYKVLSCLVMSLPSLKLT